MQFLKVKMTTLITSLAVLAIAVASLAASADARPRYGKKRYYMAATAANTGADDRYAHVQGGFTPMQPTAQSPRSRPRPMQRQSMGMNAIAFGSSGLVDQARRYVGTNPTGRASLWCGRFMNLVLERSGRSGSGSDMARSFASMGRRISGPQVGAIAVMSRGKGGGHVGIVSGIDESGNPIVISGNHGGRVGESTYPRGRIYAYVMP
jgi:uncharacterized protein (TIGR02594 family)